MKYETELVSVNEIKLGDYVLILNDKTLELELRFVFDMVTVPHHDQNHVIQVLWHSDGELGDSSGPTWFDYGDKLQRVVKESISEEAR